MAMNVQKVCFSFFAKEADRSRASSEQRQQRIVIVVAAAE